MSDTSRKTSNKHSTTKSTSGFTISTTLAAPIILSVLVYYLLIMSPHRNALLEPSRHEYPGDSVLPGAAMVYDQTIDIPDTQPSVVFPWLLQLGAQRAGWYLPFSVENLLPERMRASRVIEPKWTSLAIGQRVPDFQLPYFDKEVPEFELVALHDSTSERDADDDGDGELHAVWKSERYGCVFTWTQMVRRARSHDEMNRGEGSGAIVHLRFRGAIQSTGIKRALIVWGGEKMDWASTAPMLAGIRDRVLMMRKKS